jgi:membrane-bound acyltransferase YfiQ involved in biofilm formation
MTDSFSKPLTTLLIRFVGNKEVHMSFIIYLIGFAILIGGVAWALVTAGVPTLYVVIASVILLGIGILSGVSRTRSKDPS